MSGVNDFKSEPPEILCHHNMGKYLWLGSPFSIIILVIIVLGIVTIIILLTRDMDSGEEGNGNGNGNDNDNGNKSLNKNRSFKSKLGKVGKNVSILYDDTMNMIINKSNGNSNSNRDINGDLTSTSSCEVTSPDHPMFDPWWENIGATDNGVYSLGNDGSYYKDHVSCIHGGKGKTKWYRNKNTDESKCVCKKPFYGCGCIREAHNSDYLALGKWTPEKFNYQQLCDFPADRLSFNLNEHPGCSNIEMNPEVICTDFCDNTDGCTGVVFKNYEEGESTENTNQKQCILLFDELVVKNGEELSMESHLQSELFLKTSKTPYPKFKERVFVYRGALPRRFWLQDYYSSSNGNAEIQTIRQDLHTHMSFKPTNILNDTGCLELEPSCPLGKPLVTIFSNSPIQDGDISGIISSGGTSNTLVLSRGMTDINIPDSWENIYVITVNSDDYP